MWIDTNDCEHTFHEMVLLDGDAVCIHSDESVCNEAEWSSQPFREVETQK